jgi:uncharacterized membrane protein
MSEQIINQNKIRYAFIDVLRGLSVIWMIECHVVDANLAKIFKNGFGFDMLNISNGFISVTFLFCAGAGLYIAGSRKYDDFKHFKKPLWVYFRRLLFILLLAFTIHLPVFSLTDMLHLNDTQFNKLIECDVLQTIVYTSLFTLFLLLITPSIKYLKYIALVLALAIYYLTSFSWHMNYFNYLPSFFAAWFEQMPISKFPLLPWSGHFLVGLSLTGFFMESNNKKRFAQFAAIVSIIIPFVVFWQKYHINIDYPYVDNWWYTSPAHFIYRISVISFLFCALYLIEDFLKRSKPVKVFIVAGQESLYLYISHILIVYGSIANHGLKERLGGVFDPWGTVLMYLCVTAFCLLTAWAWHWYKNKYKHYSFLSLATIVVIYFAVFIIR